MNGRRVAVRPFRRHLQCLRVKAELHRIYCSRSCSRHTDKFIRVILINVSIIVGILLYLKEVGSISEKKLQATEKGYKVCIAESLS